MRWSAPVGGRHDDVLHVGVGSYQYRARVVIGPSSSCGLVEGLV